jgi:CDP-diacylglycerol--glycerol-3-phosphate 3-phosphatidyltransferase
MAWFLGKFPEKITPYDKLIRPLLPFIPLSIKPNYLTFFRLLMTPLLIVILYFNELHTGLFLFVILALTDLFDGALARLRNQITQWGQIWDPIADKLLIGSVIIMLLSKVNLVLTILVLCFELMFVLGAFFKKFLAHDYKISANTFGKIKMNLQCFGAGFLILGFLLALPLMVMFAELLFYLSIIFAFLILLAKGI